MFSPLNTFWRIIRNGFCLITGSLEQIGFSSGATTSILNSTEYANLITTYKSFENKSDISYNVFPNSLYYTIPILYKQYIIPFFLDSVKNFISFTSTSNFTNLISLINNISISSGNLNIFDINNLNNLTLGNLTLDQISTAAGSINKTIFTGYKVKIIFYLYFIYYYFLIFIFSILIRLLVFMMIIIQGIIIILL